MPKHTSLRKRTPESAQLAGPDARHSNVLDDSHEGKFRMVLLACRQAGLRKTSGLQAVVRFLLVRRIPASWSEVQRDADVRRTCDPSSTFRILGRPENLGIIRRFGTPARGYLYGLSLDGVDNDEVVCRQCGQTAPVCVPPTLLAFARSVAIRRGYRSV